MTTISLSKPLVDAFPGISVMAFTVRDIDAKAVSLLAPKLLALEGNNFAERFKTTECLMDELPIQMWREIYRTMGLKSSSFRSSIEALGRRALKGAMPSIMPLVDIYNASSLAGLAPLGGADLAKLGSESRVELRFAKPDDIFEPLGAPADDFPMKSSVAVYALKENVLCWGFNCRDSARYALSEETSEALFVSEALTPIGRAASETAMEHLSEALSGCANVGDMVRLDRRRTEEKMG